MAKILIAEDERDIRDLIVFTLTYGGHEVVAAPNGAELVELAPKEKPDLIMTDVRMPKMTGYEACKALKSKPETRDIPVIMLSAKGQEEEVRGGLEAGAMDYILKPFAPDQLLDRIKEILEKINAGVSEVKAKSPAEPEKKPSTAAAKPASDETKKPPEKKPPTAEKPPKPPDSKKS